MSRIAAGELKFDGVTLKQITLKVTMGDCSDESQRDCVIMGESSEDMYLQIPPGQSRGFRESVYFSGRALQLKGRLVWDYSVAELKGE